MCRNQTVSLGVFTRTKHWTEEPLNEYLNGRRVADVVWRTFWRFGCLNARWVPGVECLRRILQRQQSVTQLKAVKVGTSYAHTYANKFFPGLKLPSFTLGYIFACLGGYCQVR